MIDAHRDGVRGLVLAPSWAMKQANMMLTDDTYQNLPCQRQVIYVHSLSPFTFGSPEGTRERPRCLGTTPYFGP